MDDLNSYLPDINTADEISKSLVKEIVGTLYKKVIGASEKSVGKKSHKLNSIDKAIERTLNSLITTTFTWCTETQFFGLNTPLLTNNRTIGLDISFNIREYSDNLKKEKKISEEELFAIEKNFFIYGDPGSGKTTTLKRLVLKNFISSNSTNNVFDYPYVLRFKEILPENDLYTHIAKDFAFNYETKLIEYEDVKKVPKVNRKTLEIEYVDEILIEKKVEYYIQDTRIEQYIADFFNENKFFIALDGLDEVSDRISTKIQRQIEELVSKLNNSKMIVTCRPGYLEKKIDSFTFTQICDLDEPQIILISSCWISNTNIFLENLKSKSYYELATKPLFLSYLLVLFKESGSLPDSSQEVYDEIIDFFLVKWDKDRGVFRQSKYANFKTLVKQKFLSHLSFHLTYKVKAKVFTKQNFIDAYLLIHKRFSLPEDEAEDVSKEIESHTGIIVKAFFNKYEFCHLSLQEYLCAKYIVTEPFTYLIKDYLRVFPSPLALVVSHSSNPSSWFANIILNCLQKNNSEVENVYLTKTVNILLNRILIERPYFEKNIDLGMSLLYIATICNTNDNDFLSAFVRFYYYNITIIESVIEALEDFKYYGISETQNKALFKRQRCLIYPGAYPIDHIETIGVPIPIFDDLCNKNVIKK